jgi:hypothetical protein
MKLKTLLDLLNQIAASSPRALEFEVSVTFETNGDIENRLVTTAGVDNHSDMLDIFTEPVGQLTI